MKLQAFSRTAKKTHHCTVFKRSTACSGPDEMILSNGGALYRCGCIPPVSGESQICALLDINDQQRDKMTINEEAYLTLDEVAGWVNLQDGETPDESETENVKIGVTHDGRSYAALKSSDGELIFYDPALLIPLKDEIKSAYFKLRSRIGDNGRTRFRYLIAKDGFTTLAALMPVIVLSDEFMADLSEFAYACRQQKQLEGERIASCGADR